MRKRRKTKNILHSSVAFFYEMEAQKLPLLISLAEEHVGTRPGKPLLRFDKYPLQSESVVLDPGAQYIFEQ